MGPLAKGALVSAGLLVALALGLWLYSRRPAAGATNKVPVAPGAEGAMGAGAPKAGAAGAAALIDALKSASAPVVNTFVQTSSSSTSNPILSNISTNRADGGNANALGMGGAGGQGGLGLGGQGGAGGIGLGGTGGSSTAGALGLGGTGGNATGGSSTPITNTGTWGQMFAATPAVEKKPVTMQALNPKKVG